MQLVTGSQVEGFALTGEYTTEPPDLDIMFLYEGDWCVHIPSLVDVKGTNCEKSKAHPEVTLEGCAPGYCQIYIPSKQTLTSPFQRCSYFLLQFLNILPNHITIASSYFVTVLCLSFMEYRRWSYGYALLSTCIYIAAFTMSSRAAAYIATPSPNLFCEHDEKTILLPKAFLQELSYKVDYLPSIFQGPSHSIFNRDLVPALICSQPFPCMEQYLTRERHSIWPRPNTLAQIATAPGVLVPTGRKGSPNFPIEWRFSFSVQEICLSQEIPPWVKSGYRAFKYTLKSLLQALRISSTLNVEEVSLHNTSLEHLIDRIKSSYMKYRTDLEYLNSGFYWEMMI